MPAYDTVRFDPPAPLAQIAVRNPKGGNTVSGITMLLDSGADVTLIPRSAVNALGILPAAGQVYELMGFDGTISRASVAHLDMVFLNRTIRGQFILIDQEWGMRPPAAVCTARASCCCSRRVLAVARVGG